MTGMDDLFPSAERLSKVPATAELTQRQFQVAFLLARGYSVKKCAQIMGIGERTVRKYIERASEKVGGFGPPIQRLVVWYVINFGAPAPPDGG